MDSVLVSNQHKFGSIRINYNSVQFLWNLLYTNKCFTMAVIHTHMNALRIFDKNIKPDYQTRSLISHLPESICIYIKWTAYVVILDVSNFDEYSLSRP